MPFSRLPRLRSLPVESVPMKLLSTRIPPVPPIVSMPFAWLPPITLAWLGTLPPTVLFLPPSTRMPSPPLPMSVVPSSPTPIALFEIVVPAAADVTLIPAPKLPETTLLKPDDGDPISVLEAPSIKIPAPPFAAPHVEAGGGGTNQVSHDLIIDRRTFAIADVDPVRRVCSKSGCRAPLAVPPIVFLDDAVTEIPSPFGAALPDDADTPR